MALTYYNDKKEILGVNMNYVKKMCILRQIKQGFSGDGKTLSGLIKIEQYGKNLAVEVSIINFAPLASGEYYCLLSDGKGKTEMLSLRGKSMFNILSDLDIAGGFCGIICYVKQEVVPIAYGINGNGTYDWRTILNTTLPPVFPKKQVQKTDSAIAKSLPSLDQAYGFDDTNEPTVYEMNAYFDKKNSTSASQEVLKAEVVNVPIAEEIPVVEAVVVPEENTKAGGAARAAEAPQKESYDDEKIVTENYFEEDNREREQSTQTNQDAYAQTPAEKQGAQAGSDVAENDDAAGVLHAFKTDPDGYYLSVKRELDGLFAKYPKDESLAEAFRHSEWVRIRGTEAQPQYLVGALYEEGRVKYICYALSAENRENPPEEIKNVCAFVPSSPLEDSAGFFVIFQSAASGECVKPNRT